MKRFIASLSVFAMFIQLVPLSTVQAAANFNINLDGFSVSTQGTFDPLTGTQDGVGAFGNGNVGNQQGEYAESMCIPMIIDIEYVTTGVDNGSGPSGSVDVPIIFDYFRSQDAVIGYERMENVTTALANPDDALNLSEFTYPGTELGGVVSLPVTAGVGSGSVSGTVTGPFDADVYPGTLNDAVDADDEERYYNLNVSGIPEDTTVSFAFCARLSEEAANFPGASMHIEANGGGTIQVNPNNLSQLPDFTITKTVDNTAGGTADADDFTMQILDVNNGNTVVASFPGSATGTEITLAPGTYSVVEVNPFAEYTLTSEVGTSAAGDCTNIVANLADTAEVHTCTLTNTFGSIAPTTASLTITKTFVNNTIGATPDDFSFFGNINGATYPLTQFEADGTVVIPDVTVGSTFTISESFDADWDASYETDGVPTVAQCTGTMGANGATCEITNTYDRSTGTLTILKDLVTDSGSTETVDNFDFFIDTLSNEVELGVANVVQPDSYDIMEAWNSNHDADFPDAVADEITDWYDVTVECIETNSGDTVDVSLLNGAYHVEVLAQEDVVCTITNDDKPAQLTVIKMVNGAPVDGNGDPLYQADDFTMRVIGTDVSLDNDATRSAEVQFPGVAGDASVPSGGTQLILDAGDYTVDEINLPDPNYAGIASAGCSGTLEPGEEAVCEITNTYVAPVPGVGNVVLTKNLSGVTDPDVTPDDFQYSLTIDSAAPVVANFDATGTSMIEIPEGSTFTITEVADANYTTTYSQDGNAVAECSGTMTDGGVVNCTVTNTYRPTTLTVIVHVNNDDGGTAVAGDFLYHVLNESEPQRDDYGAEAPGKVYDMVPGEFQVALAPLLAGYSLSSSSGVCSSSGGILPIDPGEQLTCTINLDDSATTGVLTVTKVRVNTTMEYNSFSYNLTVDGTTTFHNFDETDGINTHVVPVDADFEVVEITPGLDWIVDHEGCTGQMTAGGANCTITNTYAPGTDPTEQISLLDPCIVEGDPGRLIAHFGYVSDNDDAVIIDEGINNYLTGDISMDFVGPGALVEDFLPGTNEDAMLIEFDETLAVSWHLDWDLDGISPAVVTASADSDSCDPEPRATLTVRKIVVNNGGNAQPDDFTIEVTGTDVSLDGGVTTSSSVQFQGDELGTVVTLAEGDFTVTELNGSGYDVEYVGDCDTVATLVGDLECQITNTEIGGDPGNNTLTVNVTVNGDADPALFNLFLNGETVTEFPEGEAVDMPVGDYTLFVEAPSGYELAFADDCSATAAFNASGNVAADEDAVCNVTATFAGLPSGGGSSGGGSGSNGGGSTPPGTVLGDTDEQNDIDTDGDDQDADASEDPDEASDDADTDEVVQPPAPIVAGESDELPRTGVPVAGLLALGSVLTFLARRREE